jgi:cytidylate kinase
MTRTIRPARRMAGRPVTVMANIAFAGLTAAGKTTHARRLAADLGYDYVSATDILFEIMRMPPGAHPWFTQADAVSAARESGAVDAELESRLVDGASSGSPRP